MIILALTGSIGMGKSTTAKLFAEFGVPVHDSDACVHAIYTNEAVAPIAAAFPGTVKDGVVDRKMLGQNVIGDAAAIKTLEDIVHPLVRNHRDRFIKTQKDQGAGLVLLDVPLLFETGSQSAADKIVVVSCDPALQRKRVLERPEMTVEKFEALLARQMPDSEKRARADFIVDTGSGIENARQQVEDILHTLGVPH